MTRRRATMRDVADRAGVSRTTASFVLNDRDDMRVAAATAERVRRAARELDYRPNLAARALGRSMTGTMALLSDKVTTDGYASDLVIGCVDGAANAGRMLYVGEYGGDDDLLAQYAQDFTDRGVDGFVHANTYPQQVQLPSVLAGANVVLLNGLVEDGSASCVLPDDRRGGQTAVEHLLDLGHRDLAVIGELPDDLLGAVERRRGMEEAIAAAGVPTPTWIDCNWWPESTREAVGTMLDADGPPPTALVCVNDRVALGAYQALERAGLDVPGDVSVVSFDASALASWVEPKITTLALPQVAMGRRAMELIAEPESPRAVHWLPMSLRVQGSTGAPRGA